ncbi:Hpt domain-containing protein [Pseudodesulfovibrio sp.]|nr:Hpt domain-containing protein [Pseudodesulfovibrio sp.]
MADSLFNSQLFLQSLAGDEELARELLAAFMEDSPVRRNSLAEALDAGDTATASTLAHSLKGMCGVVRADDLVSISLSMEHTANTGDLAKVKDQFAQFAELLDLVHAEMRVYLGQ